MLLRERVQEPELGRRQVRADTIDVRLAARASRGTGLGLAIVKHVVNSAGGSIEATGSPGGGLTVRARFSR